MPSSIETDHWYTPQNQVVNVIDDHFGRLDIRQLPSCYQPTMRGLVVATNLIVLNEAGNKGVQFVEAPKTPHTTQPELPAYGIHAVIGPEDLLRQVGDVPGPASMLWDEGVVVDAIRYQHPAEGYKELVEALYERI